MEMLSKKSIHDKCQDQMGTKSPQYNILCVHLLILCFLLIGTTHTTFAEESIHITWAGLEGELLENAKSYVQLSREDPSQLSKARIKNLVTKAEQEILLSLQPFGFYNAGVLSSLREPTPQEPNWQINFTVSPGEPVIIKALNVVIHGEGIENAKIKEILDNFPVRKGKVLRHSDYENAKKQVSEAALDQGFFDAKWISHQIVLDKKQNSAEIDLIYDSGPRYCIGHVHFNQQQLHEQVLKRYVPFKEGEKYSREKIMDFTNALSDSGYFQQIDIEQKPVEDTETHCIDLDVTPVLRSKGTYRTRLGYGTDTSIRFGFDNDFRYLNRYGHQISDSLGYTFEKNRYLAKIDYFIPAGLTQDSSWELSLGYKKEDFTSSDIEIADVDGLTKVEDFSIQLGWHHPRKIWKIPKLEEVFSIEYLTESYDLIPLIFDEELRDFLELFLTPEELHTLSPDFKVLSFCLGWSYQKTDDRIFTNKGYRIDLEIRGASKKLGSNVSYWQTRLNGSYIRRLHKRGRLLLHGTLAYTESEQEDVLGIEINVLPKALLFATGGDRSLRGYMFEELNGGDIIPRARHLAVASIEYEHEFLPEWSLAAFYDMGNAFNDFSAIKAKSGIGLGLRWRSPVGMVRLDVAHGVDRDGNPYRIHFTIGPDF